MLVIILTAEYYIQINTLFIICFVEINIQFYDEKVLNSQVLRFCNCSHAVCIKHAHSGTATSNLVEILASSHGEMGLWTCKEIQQQLDYKNIVQKNNLVHTWHLPAEKCNQGAIPNKVNLYCCSCTVMLAGECFSIGALFECNSKCRFITPVQDKVKGWWRTENIRHNGPAVLIDTLSWISLTSVQYTVYTYTITTEVKWNNMYWLINLPAPPEIQPFPHKDARCLSRMNHCSCV